MKPLRKIPLFVKVLYTLFAIVHITMNWRVYGPLNLLWFCDVALVVTGIALWTESRLLLSIEAVAIMIPMGLWGVDLIGRLVTHHYIFGFAGYMFDPHVPRNIRVLSWFHIWMPPLLIAALFRLGYDRRALWIQCIVVTVQLTACWFISSPPPMKNPRDAVNINWVYGTGSEHAQHAMPAWAYLVTEIVLFQLLIYIPSHFLLCWTFSQPGGCVYRLASRRSKPVARVVNGNSSEPQPGSVHVKAI